MANNVTLNSMTGGEVCATDQVGTNHYQYVKLADGTADSSAVIPGDATNGLYVNLKAMIALPAGSNAIGKLVANDAVDIGDVTINNAIGAGVYIRPGTGVNLDTSAVTITGALPAGSAAIGKLAANSGVDIGDVDVTSLPGAAHDAAVSGNPVRVAGKALNWGSSVTAVSADGDTVDLLANREGQLYVALHHPNSWSANGEYTTAQTNTSMKAAPGASLSFYITDIVFNTAVAGTVKLLNGSGGSTLYSLPGMAANGGSSSVGFRTPIKLSANTALCVTTTGTGAMFVLVNGYTAA